MLPVQRSSRTGYVQRPGHLSPPSPPPLPRQHVALATPIPGNRNLTCLLLWHRPRTRATSVQRREKFQRPRRRRSRLHQERTSISSLLLIRSSIPRFLSTSSCRRSDALAFCCSSSEPYRITGPSNNRSRIHVVQMTSTKPIPVCISYSLIQCSL